MDEKYISINEKIFELINKKGITQKELSDLTGISTSAISDWKHRGSIPSSLNVKKICKALNVDAKTILGDTDDNENKQYIINETDELYDFIEAYNEIPQGAKKRILTYAVAMMKSELEYWSRRP